MRTTGRARRGTRATTACRWQQRVVPRDAGHRGQRVLSRLSCHDRREHPLTPPFVGGSGGVRRRFFEVRAHGPQEVGGGREHVVVGREYVEGAAFVAIRYTSMIGRDSWALVSVASSLVNASVQPCSLGAARC